MGFEGVVGAFNVGKIFYKADLLNHIIEFIVAKFKIFVSFGLMHIPVSVLKLMLA